VRCAAAAFGLPKQSSLSSYFSAASPADPLVVPIVSPQVLKRFPPTLRIAGSRDFTVSSLFGKQAALTRAGVETELSGTACGTRSSWIQILRSRRKRTASWLGSLIDI
jgi:acetyl esterase/lipase